MPQPTETNRNISSLHFRSHTALLLATALPYLQPAYRHPVELALKFLEFSETLKLYREFHMQNGSLFSSSSQDSAQDQKDSGLFGLINTFILDLEGLLSSLSGVCTGSEKEIIGMFLNLIKARNFYETYGDLLKTGLMSGFDTEQTPESVSDQAKSTEKQSGFPFSGDLTSMLNDEQKETLDLLKSLFSTD